MKPAPAAILALACASAAAAQWPSSRGGPGGAASIVCEDLDTFNAPLEWRYTYKPDRRYVLGAPVWASPALAVIDGRPVAFIGGYDQTMHALDLSSRRRLWLKITNGLIVHPPAIGGPEGAEIVYWGASDRTLYAHDAREGRRVWTRELVPPSNTLGEITIGAPLIHGDKLYATCFAYDKSLARNMQKGWLFCLNAASGNVLWRLEVSQGPVNSPAGRELSGSFVVFTSARKGIIQATDVGGDAPRVLWTYQMPHEVLASPVIEPDGGAPLLFIGSKFGNFVALDAATGSVVWKRMTGNWVNNSACIGRIPAGNAVFVGSYDYNLYAFTAADGKLLWKRRLGGEAYSAPAFLNVDGKPCVAASAYGGHTYLVNAETGRVETSFYTGRPIWDIVTKSEGEVPGGSPVAVQAGRSSAIVHGSFDGAVYILPVGGGTTTTYTATAWSATGLWIGMLITLLLFFGIVLPVVILWPDGKRP